MRQALGMAMVVGMALLAAPIVNAATATYDATIILHWHNTYIGERISADDHATIVIKYDSPSDFRVTQADFVATGEGTITLSLIPGSGQNGTVAEGVGSVTVGLEGNYTGYGDYTLSNNGNIFSGSMSANGGTRFAEGDIIYLQNFAGGTLDPSIGGYNDWNWLLNSPYPTQIIFGPAEITDDYSFDANNDDDVDVGDFATFQLCFSGAGVQYPTVYPECPAMDTDHDNDIDVADFAKFQLCFSGAGVPSPCEQ